MEETEMAADDCSTLMSSSSLALTSAFTSASPSVAMRAKRPVSDAYDCVKKRSNKINENYTSRSLHIKLSSSHYYRECCPNLEWKNTNHPSLKLVATNGDCHYILMETRKEMEMVYLNVLAEPDNLPLGFDINVNFKFFVHDQIRDKYLIIQDVEGRWFHRTKTEHGFSQLISHATFKNSSNGYLVNDSSEFGLEVFVLEKRSKGVCLNMFRERDYGWYFSWDICNFSTLPQNDYYSMEFPGGGRTWNLRIYNGYGRAREKHLSLSLCLVDLPDKTNNFGILQALRKYTERKIENGKSSSRRGSSKLYVEYKLRVADKIHGKNIDKTLYGRFIESATEWGFPKFMPLSDIHGQSKGYLVNDTLVIQAKFEVIYAANEL